MSMTGKHKSNYALHLHCINMLAQGCWESVLKMNQSWVWLFVYHLSAYQRWWLDFDDSDAGLLLSSLYQVIIMCIYSVWKTYISFSFCLTLFATYLDMSVFNWFMIFYVTCMITNWFFYLAEKNKQEYLKAACWYVQVRNKVLIFSSEYN